MSDLQLAKQENPTDFYNLPGLEHYRKGTGDEPDLLYRLPELIEAMSSRPNDPVVISEGEKDVDRLLSLGFIATTNPNGALNWKREFNAILAGREVVVLIDNDDKGRMRSARIVEECKLEIFMVLYSGHSIEKTANRVSSPSRYRGTPRTFFASATLRLNVLMRIFYVRNRKI